MIDADLAVTRRAIADALMSALERRHEVLDVIVGSTDRRSAVDAITELLGTPRIASEAVMSMSFDQLTTESRKQIAAELDDLNSRLSFTARERPASSDESLRLRAFSHESDRDIFATRTEERWVRPETAPDHPRATLMMRSVLRVIVCGPRRRPGSWRSTVRTKSAWCSAN